MLAFSLQAFRRSARMFRTSPTKPPLLSPRPREMPRAPFVPWMHSPHRHSLSHGLPPPLLPNLTPQVRPEIGAWGQVLYSGGDPGKVKGGRGYRTGQESQCVLS